MQELGYGLGDGRYPRLISQEFMPDMVNNVGPKRNLFCECRTYDTMVTRAAHSHRIDSFG